MCTVARVVPESPNLATPLLVGPPSAGSPKKDPSRIVKSKVSRSTRPFAIHSARLARAVLVVLAGLALGLCVPPRRSELHQRVFAVELASSDSKTSSLQAQTHAQPHAQLPTPEDGAGQSIRPAGVSESVRRAAGSSLNGTQAIVTFSGHESDDHQPSLPASSCHDVWTILIVYVPGREQVVREGQPTPTPGPPLGCQMFYEVAHATRHGLEALGLRVQILCCPVLSRGDDCRTLHPLPPSAPVHPAAEPPHPFLGVSGSLPWDGTQVLLLGAGSLVDNVDAEQTWKKPTEVRAPDIPDPLVLRSGWLPRDTILYQFDHISYSRSAGFFGVVSGPYIGLLRHFRIWDYSNFNAVVLELVQDTPAMHCPLGFAPVYLSELYRPTFHHLLPSQLDFHLRDPALRQLPDDIDILHFGSLSPHRDEMLTALAKAGLSISEVSKPTWQEALASIIARAKVVLVLSAWKDAGEFKMTRLAPVFGLARFVVMEGTVGAIDFERYAQGDSVVTFRPGDSEQAIELLRYFLFDPKGVKEREIRGLNSYTIFREQNVRDSLRQCVEKTCGSYPG